MSYRDPGLAPAPTRPPQLVGFAFYLAGMGCAVMGGAQLLLLGAVHSWLPASVHGLTHWAMPISEVMVVLGLALTWRKMAGPHRRLVAVAMALWATMSVLDFEQERVRSSLALVSIRAMIAPGSAAYAGWALALGLLALVAYSGGRSFAARTWPTTLGISLIVADAWELAWPVLVSGPNGDGRGSAFGNVIAFDALGLFLFAGGLFAAGRSILRGVTVAELQYAKSPRARREEDEPAPDDAPARALRRGLPLLADASVAIAGLMTGLATALALARPLALLPRHIMESSAAGGTLLAFGLLTLALRRLGNPGKRAQSYAAAATASQLVLVVLIAVLTMKGSRELDDLLPYLLIAPPVLAAGALHTSSMALTTYDLDSVRTATAMTSFRARLRSASVLIAASAVTAFLASQSTSELKSYLEVIAIAVAALGLYFTIRGANDAQRIEGSVTR